MDSNNKVTRLKDRRTFLGTALVGLFASRLPFSASTKSLDLTEGLIEADRPTGSPDSEYRQSTVAEQINRDVYQRAENLLFWNVSSIYEAGIKEQRAQLIFKAVVSSHWIGNTDQFWYRNETAQGPEFVVVDPERGTRQPAFDHQKLADALSAVSGTRYTARRLPFGSFEFVAGGSAIQFDVGKDRWTCQLESYVCKRTGDAKNPSPAERMSPDGRWAAFLRDHNLYAREVATGRIVELSSDGEKYYDYASYPDSRQTAVSDLISGKPLPPQVVWSPDSKKVVTFRLDQRKVKDCYLVQSVPPGKQVRAVLYPYRYPMPGDKNVAMAKLMVFDVEHGHKVVFDVAPQIVDYITPVRAQWVWWSYDSSLVYFIDKDRGEKTLKLQVADAKTGGTKTLIQEHRSTYVEPSLTLGMRPLVRVINKGAEIIWFSERDGWAHLYLYNGRSGALKNRITSGPWVVRELLHVDESNRWVYFAAGGREKGRDPYLRHVYRIHLDGTDLQLLTPEDADHLNTPLFATQNQPPFSPMGRYFVDTYSRADIPPVTVLRSADGKLIRELERADVTRLLATGWKFPERFKTKASDGVTDIYGLIYKPSNFDPSRKYPVVDSPYPGPQAIRVTKTFFADHANAPSFAELGFIVVTVDGRGTPFRSKAFHDFSYGHMGTDVLEDHVSTLRHLAGQNPYMDLSRLGVYGHSAGGFAAVRGMLMYPDFYKVGVASAGGYDQRGYIADWGEKYEGLPNGHNYQEQVTTDIAGNLKGKLLIAFGDMDDNVPPALALQLIDALIRANKDFDTLVLPNRNHEFIFDPYFIRKEWDYLVRHLLGVIPPQGYQIPPPGK